MPSQTRAAHQAANLQRRHRGNVQVVTLSCISGALLLLGFHSYLQAAVSSPIASKQEMLAPISRSGAGVLSRKTSLDMVPRLNSQEKDRGGHSDATHKATLWALPDFFGQQGSQLSNQDETVSNRIAPVARVEVTGSSAAESRMAESGALNATASSAVKEGLDTNLKISEGSDKETVQALLDKWAGAWSGRDVDQYLGLYGEGFKPENGLSRSAWAESRRQKIESRKNITVSIRDLAIYKDGEKRLNVQFLQDYKADGFRELGTPKQLTLALEDGIWRIIAETTTSTLPKQK